MPPIDPTLRDYLYQQELLQKSRGASPDPRGQPKPTPRGLHGPDALVPTLEKRAAALPEPGWAPGFLASEPGPREVEQAMGPIMGMLGPTVTAFKGMNAYSGGPTYRSSPQGMVKIADDPHVQIDEFNSPNNPWAGFFSDDPKVASRFAEAFGKEMKGAVYPVKIDFKNPATIDAEGRHAAAYQFDQVGREQGVKNATGLIKRLFDKNPKIDGVILKNTADEGTVYIPRNPQQITSNVGGK